MSLFDNIESQYIDENGKTRILNYGSGISLMVNPIPPLDLPVSREIYSASRKKVLDFINGHGLKITKQEVSTETSPSVETSPSTAGDSAEGFWVEEVSIENARVTKGYIPVESTKPLKNVERTASTQEDPIRVETESELQQMHHSRKVADFLKQYTLFEYAKDPENFGKDSFIVKKNHVYDIESLGPYLTPNNKVMYHNGKLVVLDKETIKRLLSFLKVQILNDRNGVMAYRDRSVVKDYFRTLSDFRKTPDQLIFLSKASLVRWDAEKHSDNKNQVVSYFIRDTKEPYIFRHPKFLKGRMVMIQNVKDGDLELCFEVGEKWVKDRVNLGYKPTKLVAADRVSYTVYSEDGSFQKVPGEGDHVYVIEYSNQEYGAILPF